MSGDRSAFWTNILGISTAVIGLLTAVIVLVATFGSNQGGGQPASAAAILPTATPTATATEPRSSSTTQAPDPSPTPAPTPTPLTSTKPSAEPSESAQPATPAPTATPPPPPTPAPTPTPRPIAFYSVRDDPAVGKVNADIYIVDVATGVETRLTTEVEPDSDPAWSPDGARLAFDSRRVGGRRDLWVIEPGGSFTRLTDDARDDAFPTWSPDGMQIAWAAGPSGSREIWVADARDGSGATRVTTGHDDLFPAWSATGLIAFQRRAGAEWEVWVVRPDGSGPVVRISVGDGGGLNPAWSPDGKRFAFVRPVAGVNRIFIVAANGASDLVELTRGDACDCEQPTWSPDGTQIAYVGPRGTIRPILIIPAKGGTARRVTANGLTPFWGT